MKVIVSDTDILEFDNGLKIEGEGEIDCCAHNYLDFTQFVVGDEFPDMTAGEFVDKVNLKEDGFALTASDGLPKWAQARSEQNGCYSSVTSVSVKYKGKTIMLGDFFGEQE